MDNNELVICQGLTKNYGKKTALNNLNLTLGRGQFIGPNGSGKTTTIKLLNGLLQPTSGSVLIDGQAPGTYTHSIISYLPDKNYLNDAMKVNDLISFFADFYTDFDRVKATDMLDSLQIDPLNRLDQQLEPGQTELMYITSLLGKLGRFAAQHKCLVILVAHPRKMNRNTATGELRRVEMNDINGSANFGNMSDYCLCVNRDDAKQLVTVYIDKVRFKHLGSGYTHAKFVYNRINGRYWPCEEDIVHGPDGDKPGPVNTKFDNENWLKNNSDQGYLFD